VAAPHSGVRAGLAAALAASAATGAAHAQQTNEPPPLPPTTPTETQPSLPPFATLPGKPHPRDPLLIDQIRARQNAPTPAQEGLDQVPANERNRVIIENADVVRGKEGEGVVIAEGNVRLRYNGYVVTCDRATWDRRKRVVTFESHVILNTGGQTIYAEYVHVDARTNEFAAREGRTVIPPDLVGTQILQPVRLSGETVSRTGRNFNATNGVFTTCDFPDPHYKVGFRQADLIPNDRLVLRDAVIYRYEKPILRVKYLVVPIRDDIRYSYLPQVGRTNEEGWFVKAAVGYALGKFLPGLLRIDVMQKKGIGLGFDQAYRSGANAAGAVALYSLNDQNNNVHNWNGRVNHQQYLGDTLATVSTDFQRNSYQSITPQSQTSNTNLALARTTAARTTNVSLSYNNSDYSTTRTDTTAYTISDTEKFGQTGNLTFRLNGSDNTSQYNGSDTSPSSTTGRQEQTADIRATGKVGIFDADLTANKSLLLRQKGTSNSGGLFSGTQKLPDFLLSTDADRLGGFLRTAPLRFSFGYGRFLESVSSFVDGATVFRPVTTARALFAAETSQDPNIPLTRGGGLSFSYGGGFRQAVYREDAAQYVLTARSTVRQRLGGTSNLNFNYNYVRPYGGTPPDFRLDQTGSINNVAAGLTVDSYRTRLSLLTGYDIERAGADVAPGFKKNPWQNLSGQLAFRPSPIFQTRFTAAYDFNTGQLLDATNRIRLRGRNNSALDTSLRYDPRTNKFPQITEAATLPFFSRDVFLTALAGYNGVRRQFDYKQFGINWSFHDYEYQFSFFDQPYGFRTERGFNISIRLKALPSFQPPATGQFGTSLDTGTGEVF
jgi:lipopolysaccharide assembly outer membrane protein LptD (OstA)